MLALSGDGRAGQGMATLNLTSFLKEAPDQVEASARMGQEQVMPGAADGLQTHPGIGVGEVAQVIEGGHRVLLAVDEQRRGRRNRRHDAIHLVVEQTVIEGRGQRLEGEFVAVDQHGPGEAEKIAQRDLQAAALHLGQRFGQRVLVEEASVVR